MNKAERWNGVPSDDITRTYCYFLLSTFAKRPINTQKWCGRGRASRLRFSCVRQQKTSQYKLCFINNTSDEREVHDKMKIKHSARIFVFLSFSLAAKNTFHPRFSIYFVSTAISACFNTFCLLIERALLFSSRTYVLTSSQPWALNTANNGIRKEILISFESTQQRASSYFRNIFVAWKEFNIVETTRIHYAICRTEA